MTTEELQSKQVGISMVPPGMQKVRTMLPSWDNFNSAHQLPNHLKRHICLSSKHLHLFADMAKRMLDEASL